MSTISAPSRSASYRRRPASVRVLRGLGWTLIAAGVVVLLYVAYALWFTGFETERAQQQLREQWDREVAAVSTGGGPTSREPAGTGPQAASPTRADRDGTEDDGTELEGTEPELQDGDEAVAMMQFARPGGETTPVRPDPLFIVPGVGYQNLTRGPGHYPDTELPGEDGNFAVAGHRTTYDAPFYSLNELREGDEIHVTDRSGDRHVYEFVARRIVEPTSGWVLQDDPLDRGEPMLTLTTCHPRFSAAQRMVVFAELVG